MLLLFVLCSAPLIGCGRTLDTAKIEEDIRSNVVKQGGTSLKSVICPTNIKPAPGASFECIGVLDGGSGFTIPVKQDDQGNVNWEIPSVKGLLNMTQLQTEFEQNLKKEVGQASIECGSPNPYRAVKPGETFECQLVKRSSTSQSTPSPAPRTATTRSSAPDSTKSTDAVQITVQPSGDVNWQRVIKTPDAKVAASPTASPTKLPEPPKSSKPDSDKPESSPAPSPAAPSAEEFLKQPGAADDFN